LEILADAVDQALNATTALFSTLRTEAAFHFPVSDQKFQDGSLTNGWKFWQCGLQGESY
jgi:hypothetical protein